MIVDNTTSFRGIFNYSDTASYEKDDFIVDGTRIYICTANNPTSVVNGKCIVSGIRPSDSSNLRSKENFLPFLGDQVCTLEEYDKYLEDRLNNLTTEDKYISAALLEQVLQRLSFGYGKSGVITSADNYINNELDLDEPSSILDKILQKPELNNGIFTISRDLPEIKSLFYYSLKEAIKGAEESELGYKGALDLYYIGSSKVVLLKQYTYDDGIGADSSRWRLQELIDPVTGETFFRSSKGTRVDDGWSFDTKTSFASNLSGCNFSIAEKLRALELFKQQEIIDLQNTKQSLIGTFRFVNYEIDSTKNEVSILRTSNVGTVFTILVRTLGKGSVYRNYSTTINVLDSRNETNYYLSDDVNLTVNVSDTTIKFTVPTGNFISNIYYRLKYNG